MPADRTVVVRNRANQASGLMIQAVLAGYMVVGDPLRLTTAHDLTLAPEERVMSGPWVWTVVGLAVFSLWALAVFYHPRLEVTDRRVVLRNALTDVSLERDGVVGVRTAGETHPVLVTTSGDVRLHCVEQSVRMLLKRKPHRIARLLRELFPWRSDAEPNAAVTRAWRRPSALEVAVGLVWLVLVTWSVLRLP